MTTQTTTTSVGMAVGLTRLAALVDTVTTIPDGWETNAVCKGMPTEWFYPERGESQHRIRQVCQTCPVQAECLATALTKPERHGVWGGASEKQRRKLRRQLRTTTNPTPERRIAA